MNGIITLYESGQWVASGAMNGAQSLGASSVRSYAEATISAGSKPVMVASFEIHKGDFTCHEAVDLDALRCLQRLVAFLEAA